MVARLLTATTALLALFLIACGSGTSPAASPVSTRAAPTPTPRAAGPQARVEPRSGPPGTQVTVSGSGWPAGATIELTGFVGRLIASEPYETVTAGADGSFSVRFRLEKAPDGSDLQVGRFDLIARTSDVQVGVPFLVETRRPLPGNGPGG